MFDSCLKCELCYENCYLEQMGISSFVRLPLQDDDAGIWNCSNCWTCHDICPAGIPLMDLKWEIQQTLEPPSRYMASLQNIFVCGYCLPIEPDDINPFRLDDGLEPITLADTMIVAALLQIK